MECHNAIIWLLPGVNVECHNAIIRCIPGVNVECHNMAFTRRECDRHNMALSRSEGGWIDG